MAANMREARRKKILERGSDRLALITGRIDSLPTPSSPPLQLPCDRGPDATSQPLISQDEDLQPRIADEITVSDNEDKLVSPPLPKHDPVTDHGINTAPPSHEHNVNNEEEVEASYRIFSSMNKQYIPTQTPWSRFFTPNQLSSAISATERIRLYCSMIIATLVVLSSIRFPLPVRNIVGVIMSFRPLYLVLLTDITLVLARLLSNKQVSIVAIREENGVPALQGNSWPEQVSKALELGFLLQKGMNAVLMDCSVYMVIVVSCLSFLQSSRT